MRCVFLCRFKKSFDLSLLQFASRYADQSGYLPPIIYMGDFNMTPLSPMYELMALGHLYYKGININNISGALFDEVLPLKLFVL